jgi:hypothetical protein
MLEEEQVHYIVEIYKVSLLLLYTQKVVTATATASNIEVILIGNIIMRYRNNTYNPFTLFNTSGS